MHVHVNTKTIRTRWITHTFDSDRGILEPYWDTPWCLKVEQVGRSLPGRGHRLGLWPAVGDISPQLMW